MTIIPARLLKVFPEFRRLILVLADEVGGDATLQSMGFGLLQLSLSEIATAWNSRLDTIPVEQRPARVDFLFEYLEEIERVAAFTRFGRQCFVLSDSIVGDLRRSGLGDVEVSDIRLPYPMLYAAFATPVPLAPGRDLVGIWARQNDERLQFRLCFSTLQDECVEFSPYLGFSFELDREPGVKLNAALGSQIEAVERRIPQVRQVIEQAASAATGTIASVAHAVETTGQERLLDELKSAGPFLSDALQLAGNVLCLLSSAPAEMIGKTVWSGTRFQVTKKNKKEHFQRGELPVRHLEYPGKTCRSAGQENLEAAARKSSRTHWRRGHWRRQPYGPKGAQAYRPKWIRPVLVSLEAGPMAEASIYSVSGDHTKRRH
jgi:hypothetical protein